MPGKTRWVKVFGFYCAPARESTFRDVCERVYFLHGCSVRYRKVDRE